MWLRPGHDRGQVWVDASPVAGADLGEVVVLDVDATLVTAQVAPANVGAILESGSQT
jgi:hypothetical protein